MTQHATSQWRNEAEKAILNGLFAYSHRDPELFSDVLEIFPAEHWHDFQCRTTALAVAEILAEGQEVTPVEAGARIYNKFNNATVWLAEVLTQEPFFAGPSFLKIEAQKQEEEHLKDLTEVNLSQLLSTCKSPNTPLDFIQTRLAEVAEELTKKSLKEQDENDQLKEYFDTLGAKEERLTSSPWNALNRVLGGGVAPGELIVLAARPSVGKSALAVNWAWYALAYNQPVVFFSLEMSKREIFDRMVAKLGDINSRIFRGKIEDKYLEKVQYLKEKMIGKPIYVDDRGTITMSEIRRISRIKQRKHGHLGLIVIDYLQLITPEGNAGNREQEVAAISKKCKALAKDLQCPVILLAQLNRELEREKREPKLSDLRESGAIEQDADVVLFLHQSEKTTKVCKEKNLPEPLNVLVGKGRNTGTGFAQLAYKKETQNIFDMDETTRDLISLAVTEPKKNEIVEL